MDESIMNYVKRKYNLLIGERMAEQIKIEIGSAAPIEKPVTTEIKGRSLIEGIPKTITVDDSEIREALNEGVTAIVSAIRVFPVDRGPRCIQDERGLRSCASSGRGPGVGPGWGGGIGGGTYRVGGGVTAPRIIYAPDPEFSEEARKAKFQGTVVLWAIVGPDGRTHDIRVYRSLGMGLDEKAIEAIRQWRFEPGRKDGIPVAVQVKVEVNFRLY
jgi:TonB family protein